MKKLMIIFISIHIWLGNFILKAQVIESPNFIFIIVDDLNDFVQPFTNDQPQVESPSFNQLAAAGTIFLNAFSSAPGCAPSRTSFLTGKDITYTQIYNNDDFEPEFRLNFTSAKGNEEVYTLPEVMKDKGDYFTFGINKIYHIPSNNDFDASANPECEKSQSWNRQYRYDLPDLIVEAFQAYAFDEQLQIGQIPDSLENTLADFVASEVAVQFIHDYASGEEPACGNPFFLTVGMKYPHNPRFIPASYLPDYYLNSIYDEPYQIPYQHPENNYPYNGVVMPPQPEPVYHDYDALPEYGIARQYADYDYFYEIASTYYDSLLIIPEIDPLLDDSVREFMIEESIRANYVISYIAAVKYMDAQIGKIIDALNAHPDLKENTIIVLISDNGYSLGEKRHWEKWSLWETDLRIPFIIVDPSKPGGQIVDQAVSPLDIFPTICEMAGILQPEFADGSNYLDGNSLIPLLNNPALRYAQPAISFCKRSSGKGSCYPAISVRNERFHYISYRENNDGTFDIAFCDPSNFSFEEELYEIGEQRETDPHEYNNLISNEDYQPVVEYLQQFLPDSNIYQQSTYLAIIQNQELNCFLAETDTIHLSFDWFNQNGTAIVPTPAFTYKWSNNLTEDIFWGISSDFYVQSISDEVFDSVDRMMVYLQVYDTLNHLIAFDTKYYYINPANTPTADFTVTGDGTMTATITDFNINGTYSSYWWNFGNGNMFVNQIPGEYTFDEPGTYPVTLNISFGNDCIFTIQQEFITSVQQFAPPLNLTISPNPADEYLNISGSDLQSILNYSIFDFTGKLVVREETISAGSEMIRISTKELNPGYYLIRTNSINNFTATPFIVMH